MHAAVSTTWGDVTLGIVHEVFDQVAIKRCHFVAPFGNVLMSAMRRKNERQ